jgi:hypothetical protein
MKQLIDRSKKKIGQIDLIVNSIQLNYENERIVVRLVINKPFTSSPKKKWLEPIFLSVW